MSRFKFKEITNYVMIFTVIYFSSSFFALSIKGTISILSILIMSLITLIANSNSLKANYKNIVFFLIIVIFSIFSLMYNGDTIYDYLIFWVAFLSAMIIYISIPINEFVDKYCKIVGFLAIFSLVTFVASILFPKFITMFPIVTNNTGVSVHNMIFSVNNTSTSFVSNYGLFWEPGAYQTFLNIAIFFQLFFYEKIGIKRIIVLIIAIITTFSTTAYISSGLIIVIYFLFVKVLNSEQKKIKRKIMKILLFLIIIGSIFFTQIPNSIKFKVFGKLEAIFNPNLLSTYSYSSTAARVSSITIPLKNLLINPIVGVGFSKLFNYAFTDGHGFLTATPLNWFGLFGLICGMLINYSLWLWTKVCNRNYLTRLLLFIFLLLIVMTENYNRNSFYLLFILYGLDITKAIRNHNCDERK